MGLPAPCPHPPPASWNLGEKLTPSTSPSEELPIAFFFFFFLRPGGKLIKNAPKMVLLSNLAQQSGNVVKDP